MKHLLLTDTFERGEFGWQSGFTADDSNTMYFLASVSSRMQNAESIKEQWIYMTGPDGERKEWEDWKKCQQAPLIRKEQ